MAAGRGPPGGGLVIPALAVLLDFEGAITERVLFGFEGVEAPARFTDLFGSAGRAKAQNFVESVARDGVVAGWQLSMPAGGSTVAARFSGVRRQESIIVFGWCDTIGLYDLYDELARGLGEQTDGLFEPLKQIAGLLSGAPSADDAAFRELTRLSNEFGVTQRELAKVNVELAATARAKDVLLATVSHDLRTPINSVANFAALVLQVEGAGLLPDSVKMLERSVSVCAYMTVLVEDLLDLAAMESGHLRLDRSACDVADVIDEALELIRPAAVAKQIELIVELASNVDAVLDVPRIQQVIANLLTNAIKYSVRGSRVWVSARWHDGPLVEVRDEGPGIPAGQLQELFSPFSVTSVRGTEGEKSTGLGLAIATGVIEAHGGRLWVESEVGRGSTFSCSLPVV
jgi:two-component system OmpR family sensor kinase